MTITHDTLDLIVQAPVPSPSPDIRHRTPPALASSPASDIWWPSVETLQTCSLEGPSLTSTDIWWLEHVRLPNGWYASYWNVFLVKFRSAMDIRTLFTFFSSRPRHPELTLGAREFPGGLVDLVDQTLQ